MVTDKMKNSVNGTQILDTLDAENSDNKIGVRKPFIIDEETKEFLKFFIQNYLEIEKGFEETDIGYYDKEISLPAIKDNPYAFNIELEPLITEAIQLAVFNNKAWQKAADKTMMASVKNAGSDITRRSVHMQQVAKISKIIALGLGLNSNFASLIGFLHDIGHTFNGHSGQEIFDASARYRNCAYINHNAMGEDILEREDLVKKSIHYIDQLNKAFMLPINKKDYEEIERFLRNAYNGILSHDGEGVNGTIRFVPKTFEQIDSEKRDCFTKKGYYKKIIPCSLEAAIIRYSDIMAYERTDILDGMRLVCDDGEKILPEFTEEYLKIIAVFLAKSEENTEMLDTEYKLLHKKYFIDRKIKNLAIEIDGIKLKIEELKLKQFSENNSLIKRKENERNFKIKEKELQEAQLKEIEEKIEEVDKIKIEYAKTYIRNNLSDEDSKIAIVDEILLMQMVDIINTSKCKDIITASPLIKKNIFLLRSLNGKKIVPNTRRGYEIGFYPEKVNQLVEELSSSIVSTGIIAQILKDNNLESVELSEEDSEIYDEHTKENKKEIENKKNKNKKCNRKIYNDIKRMPNKIFLAKYDDAKKALADIAYHDLLMALGEEEYDKEELKELYLETKIKPLQEKIEKEFPGGLNNTEDRKKFLEELIEQRMEFNIERLMADKFVIEYLARQSNGDIEQILLDQGIINKEQIEGENAEIKRGEEDPNVKKMVNKWNQVLDALILTPEEVEEELQEEARRKKEKEEEEKREKAMQDEWTEELG